jgi:hypothetical protein
VPNIIKATVTAGLTGAADGIDWIVDPDQFRILTSSTIPANHGLWSTSATQTAELPNVVASYQRAPAPPQPAAEPGARAEPGSGPPPASMFLQLDYGTLTYSGTQVWAPVLNIAPMSEEGVASYHTVTLLKRDENGHYTSYVTGVTAAPQLGASNTALWGAKGQAGDPNADRLIPATLTGLAISAVPRRPDKVSAVPLQALAYAAGYSTGFAYQAPVVDQRYTVTAQASPDAATLTIDVAGAHTASLVSHGYALSALTDPWVAGQRAATLEELRRLGFTTIPAGAAGLAVMAQTALTDWPSAARIGSETWA